MNTAHLRRSPRLPSTPIAALGAPLTAPAIARGRPRFGGPVRWGALGALLAASPALAWDPDAGVVPSLTSGATLSATSGTSLSLVLDGLDDTHWTSDSCFPQGFLTRADLNPALGACTGGGCTLSSAGTGVEATDGSIYTGAAVNASGGVASLRVPFASARPLVEVAYRGAGAAVDLYAETSAGEVFVGTYGAGDAYSLRRYTAPSGSISALVARSAGNFNTTELAAVDGPCVESVVADLGSVQDVGWVRSRHWAGGRARSTTLSTSLDGLSWTPAATLDPAALGAVLIEVPSPARARYLKVSYETLGADYDKVYLWELDAWNADGPHGPMPAAGVAPTDLRTMLGVNGIWGWGTGAYTDLLGAGAGASRYAPVASHGRSYHNLSWDVTDPDIVPDYSVMSTAGTQANWWLDWDREYGAWTAAGLSVYATVQFLNTTNPSWTWDDPYGAAYAYAYAFARHFGPTAGTGDVLAVEAGNEPWDYTAAFYTEVLEGFVDGVHDGDPAMIVMPCALQASDPQAETETGGHYLGARVPEAVGPLLDAINIHSYSYAINPAGTRIAVQPEDPRSTQREVLDAMRWRDENLPGTPLWLTEWGWDSTGAGESCTGSDCVTERAQALYAVRGALMWSRLGLDRATWFFYANDGSCDTLYCRSGLTGSVHTGFAPKASFIALQALIATLGDRRVVGVLQEDDEAWAYLLGGADGVADHLVAWRPVAEADTDVAEVRFSGLPAPIAAWTLAGVNPAGERVALPTVDAEGLLLEISSAPLVVSFVEAGGADGGADGGTDGGADGGADGGTDGGTDAGADGGTDGAADGGADGATDGGADGGADATGDDTDETDEADIIVIVKVPKEEGCATPGSDGARGLLAGLALVAVAGVGRRRRRGGAGAAAASAPQLAPQLQGPQQGEQRAQGQGEEQRLPRRPRPGLAEAEPHRVARQGGQQEIGEEDQELMAQAERLRGPLQGRRGAHGLARLLPERPAGLGSLAGPHPLGGGHQLGAAEVVLGEQPRHRAIGAAGHIAAGLAGHEGAELVAAAAVADRREARGAGAHGPPRVKLRARPWREPGAGASAWRWRAPSGRALMHCSSGADSPSSSLSRSGSSSSLSSTSAWCRCAAAASRARRRPASPKRRRGSPSPSSIGSPAGPAATRRRGPSGPKASHHRA